MVKGTNDDDDDDDIKKIHYCHAVRACDVYIYIYIYTKVSENKGPLHVKATESEVDGNARENSRDARNSYII